MQRFLLKSAMAKVPIEIIYQAKDGSITQRVILVKKITDSTILAYCYTKRQFRTFSLNQILAYGHIGKQDYA